jgi:hypothetical protein
VLTYFFVVVERDILKEFAFVHMESDNDAMAAIAGLNDSLRKGGRLRVELSTTKTTTNDDYVLLATYGFFLVR